MIAVRSRSTVVRCEAATLEFRYTAARKHCLAWLEADLLTRNLRILSDVSPGVKVIVLFVVVYYYYYYLSSVFLCHHRQCLLLLVLPITPSLFEYSFTPSHRNEQTSQQRCKPIAVVYPFCYFSAQLPFKRSPVGLLRR